MGVLAGTDFFTVVVLTWRGLVTHYVLFFIHLGSRWVSIAGVTDHPDASWISQVVQIKDKKRFEEIDVGAKLKRIGSQPKTQSILAALQQQINEE